MDVCVCACVRVYIYIYIYIYTYTHTNTLDLDMYWFMWYYSNIEYVWYQHFYRMCWWETVNQTHLILEQRRKTLNFPALFLLFLFFILIQSDRCAPERSHRAADRSLRFSLGRHEQRTRRVTERHALFCSADSADRRPTVTGEFTNCAVMVTTGARRNLRLQSAARRRAIIDHDPHMRHYVFP